MVYELWKKYHLANPQFYELFERFAREAMRTHAKIGARLLCERMRWYEQVERGNTPYRVCNSFAAYYARLLMLDKPDFKSLFNTKPLKSGVTDDDIIRDVIETFRIENSDDPDDSADAPSPKAAYWPKERLTPDDLP
jgi:hypothetical protein